MRNENVEHCEHHCHIGLIQPKRVRAKPFLQCQVCFAVAYIPTTWHTNTKKTVTIQPPVTTKRWQQ